MSFRNEEKIKLNSSKIFDFEKWIKINNGQRLYPPRIVNSIYFDNLNFSMYEQSMEGVTPRKKIRIRTYGNNFFLKDSSKFKKETKITSSEGRFKNSEKFSKPIKSIFSGIYDANYGFCYPSLNVFYNRRYYKVKNVRITLDTDIKYKKIISNNISHMYTSDKYNVAEIKYDAVKYGNIFNSEFPFERTRFSKYCRGLEFSKINYCNEI